MLLWKKRWKTNRMFSICLQWGITGHVYLKQREFTTTGTTVSILVSGYLSFNWVSEQVYPLICVWLCKSMDCSLPAPLSMGSSRREYWSALPFPPSGDLSDPGIKPGLLHLLHWWQVLYHWTTWEADVCEHLQFNFNLFCVSLSWMCPWAIASSLHTILIYKKFLRNTLLWIWMKPSM